MQVSHPITNLNSRYNRFLLVTVPHIGHLYSLVIADIFARYQKILQPNRHVEFLAGTDEHGLKIQKAAQAKGLPPDVFCSQLSDQFRVCLEMLLATTATNFFRASGKQGTNQSLPVHANYTTKPS